MPAIAAQSGREAQPGNASAVAAAGDAATAASQREAREKRKLTQRWSKKKPKKPKARRTWMAAALIGPVPGWHPATKAMEAGEEEAVGGRL